MKLTAKQKLIVAGAIFALVVVIAAVVLIIPQFSRLSDLAAQIDQAERDIADARVLLERRQSVKGRSAETEAQILKLANEVPDSPELPSLIVELQDVANQSGLEFSALTPQEPMPGDFEESDDDEIAEYDSVRIAMAVRGTWQDCVDLLQRLRRVGRQLRVDSFQVIPVELEQGTEESEEGTSTVITNQVDMTVVLEAYTMDVASVASTSAVPPAPPTGQ